MDSRHVLRNMKDIFLAERDVQDIWKDTFRVWFDSMMLTNQATRMSSEIRDTVHEMGSLADGTFSARMFVEDEFTFESDFMLEIMSIPPRIIKRVGDGFYIVENDGHFLDYLIGAAKHFLDDNRTHRAFIEAFLNTGVTHGVLLGGAIKLLVEQAASLKDGSDDMTHVMTDVYGVPASRLHCSMETEYNGPATTQNIHVTVDGQHRVSLSIDVVICGKLATWPAEAQEWEHRKRRWPSRRIVEEIIKDHNVHLVAKPSQETVHGESKDWRLTFLAEKRIIKEHTEHMRFTYYIFKVLFYKYFKVSVVDGKTLPSYLAKTTMHWMCEEVDPNSWTEANTTSSVQKLLHRLFSYLEAGKLPNYFIPGINLLKNIDKKLVHRTLHMDKLIKRKLLDDPIGCLPTCYEKVLGRLELCMKISKAGIKYFTGLAQSISPSFRYEPTHTDSHGQHTCAGTASTIPQSQEGATSHGQHSHTCQATIGTASHEVQPGMGIASQELHSGMGTASHELRAGMGKASHEVQSGKGIASHELHSYRGLYDDELD